MDSIPCPKSLHVTRLGLHLQAYMLHAGAASAVEGPSAACLVPYHYLMMKERLVHYWGSVGIIGVARWH